MFNACVNLMYVGRPAVMVSAILAARHRTFVVVVTSLFVLCVFPMHNKFLLLLLQFISAVELSMVNTFLHCHPYLCRRVCLSL